MTSQERNLSLNPTCLLALALLISTQATAQERLAAKISAETTDEIPAASGVVLVSAPPSTAPATAPKKVIDKKFIFTMAALGGAEAMRFTSRKLVLDNEFAAGAPWVTHVPANSNLVVKYAGLYSAEFLVSCEIKKPHDWLPGDRIIRKFWWAYPAAMTFIHIKNGVGNLRTQGPGGCTAIECAEQTQ
jgi:hypothetical protein